MSEAKVRANRLLQEASGPSVEEITASLRELGLGGYAAGAFGALARATEATAADLVRETGIPDSKIYYALDELVEKGLVEVQEGKPKTFRALPPREVRTRLERIVEGRRDRDLGVVDRLVTRMEPLRAAARTPTTDLAYIVKGKPNVLARMAGMVASARGEVVLVTSDAEALQGLETELARAARRRVSLKLAVPDVPLAAEIERRAEVRRILCSCTLLVVDGVQVITVNHTEDGSAYGITSTDETLVRLGQEYWESPRCSAPPRPPSPAAQGDK